MSPFTHYTIKIPEVRDMNYWERLQFMKMYSQGRGKLQSIQEGSFTIHGSNILNFKNKLYKYLGTLPVEPKVGNSG
jgi:hypothetical protein